MVKDGKIDIDDIDEQVSVDNDVLDEVIQTETKIVLDEDENAELDETVQLMQERDDCE